jgi:hypothetical protein
MGTFVYSYTYGKGNGQKANIFSAYFQEHDACYMLPVDESGITSFADVAAGHDIRLR